MPTVVRINRLAIDAQRALARMGKTLVTIETAQRHAELFAAAKAHAVSIADSALQAASGANVGDCYADAAKHVGEVYRLAHQSKLHATDTRKARADAMRKPGAAAREACKAKAWREAQGKG